MNMKNLMKAIIFMALVLVGLDLVLFLRSIYLSPSPPGSKLDFEIWVEQSPSVITFYIRNRGSEVHNVVLHAKGTSDFSWGFDRSYGDIPKGVIAIIPFLPPDPAYSWTQCGGYPYWQFDVTVECRKEHMQQH
jgi:hypothetical protein